MDSMRSLNTSLPKTSPQRKGQQQSQQQPPEDILSAFKAAALSVTTLYKSAASLQAPARAAGYQDALTDLLTFLDRENIGLDDGEGWNIRQWATERLDGPQAGRHDTEDEEEDGAEEERAESVPAETQDQTAEEDLASSVELPPANVEDRSSAPPTERHSSEMPKSNIAFTFHGQQQQQIAPTNHERDTPMDGQESTTATATPSVKFEPTLRQPRTRHHRLPHQRSSTSLRTSMGSGAGSKRRMPFGDFFDLSGINFESKEGNDRGGKRGRHA